MQKEKVEDPSQGFLYRTLSRILPVAKGDSDGQFFMQRKGQWKATSLFLALLMIEGTDIIFALDSIPA